MPPERLESIAPRAGGVGFDVWHDDTRYRVHPLQQRFTQSEHHGDMVRLGVKVASTKWCEFLVPKVSAEPPPGVKVRRPWSSFVHGLVVIEDRQRCRGHLRPTPVLLIEPLRVEGPPLSRTGNVYSR